MGTEGAFVVLVLRLVLPPVLAERGILGGPVKLLLRELRAFVLELGEFAERCLPVAGGGVLSAKADIIITAAIAAMTSTFM